MDAFCEYMLRIWYACFPAGIRKQICILCRDCRVPRSMPEKTGRHISGYVGFQRQIFQLPVRRVFSQKSQKGLPVGVLARRDDGITQNCRVRPV